jgi:hypothetical protein
MSGARRGARLKRCASGARMHDGCSGRRMHELEGLRNRQRRRHGGQRRTGQSNDGTDRAKIIRMLIGVVTRRRQVMGGMDRGGSVCCDAMDMAERKHELNDKREQRQPRAMPDVRSKPLHPGDALSMRDDTTACLASAQRPSRAQVAAKAPSSNSKPIRPAKIGRTPTPLTTLASRIFTPIQPSPRKMLEA